jgi:hypothetical protein
VGALLGFADTEAVMQQGQFFDEDQRKIQADDIATLMYAMTGLDETVGGDDDYTIHMRYAGLTDQCDIVVSSSANINFGGCTIGGRFIDFLNFPTHIVITNAKFDYNPDAVDWFFNQSLRCEDLSLDWPHNQRLNHHACGDLVLKNGFTVGSKGIVGLKAGGDIRFEPGTSVGGILRIRPGTPVPP